MQNVILYYTYFGQEELLRFKIWYHATVNNNPIIQLINQDSLKIFVYAVRWKRMMNNMRFSVTSKALSETSNNPAGSPFNTYVHN